MFKIKSFGNYLGGRTLNQYDDSTSSELISRLSGSSRAAKELSSSFGEVPEKNDVKEDRRLKWDGYDVWDYNP